MVRIGLSRGEMGDWIIGLRDKLQHFFLITGQWGVGKRGRWQELTLFHHGDMPS